MICKSEGGRKPFQKQGQRNPIRLADPDEPTADEASQADWDQEIAGIHPADIVDKLTKYDGADQLA